MFWCKYKQQDYFWLIVCNGQTPKLKLDIAHSGPSSVFANTCLETAVGSDLCRPPG